MPVLAGIGADGLAGPISVQLPVDISALPCRTLPDVAPLFHSCVDPSVMVTFFKPKVGIDTFALVFAGTDTLSDQLLLLFVQLEATTPLIVSKEYRAEAVQAIADGLIAISS